jgi:hypothetical protein
MKLKLIPRKKSEHVLVLSLNYGFRLFFHSVGVAIAGAIIVDASSEINTMPLIISTLFIMFGLYQDSWIFDRHAKKVEQRHGLLFLYRSNTISFEQMSAILMSSFIKGGKGIDRNGFDGKLKLGHQPKTHLRLFIQNKDGSVFDIEIAEQIEGMRLELIGNAVSSLCSIPFHKEASQQIVHS